MSHRVPPLTPTRFLRGLFSLTSRKLKLRFGPTGHEVPEDDDNIDRWLVRHYRYDPSRKQMSHFVVAAFSNEKAQSKYYRELTKSLNEKKLRGEALEYEEITYGHSPSGTEAGRAEFRREKRAFYAHLRIPFNSQE